MHPLKALIQSQTKAMFAAPESECDIAKAKSVQYWLKHVKTPSTA